MGRLPDRETTVPVPDAGDARMRSVVRILVVKLSSLGDVAHAVPAVAALALLYPGSEIDWLVEPPGAPFVDALPWVGETVVLDAKGALARGARALASERNRVASRLKARRYDLVVDLQGLLRSSLWTLWSGAKKRVGRGRWPWLHLKVSMYDRARTPHAIENTARVVEVLGASVAEGWVESRRGLAPLADRLRARGEALAAELGLPRGYAAGFPTASSAAKSLDPGWLERWPGPPLVLLGDARLAAWRPEASGVLNLGGALPLLDSLALALAAGRVVSADTGPAHLAALLGAKAFSLHGPTPPWRTGLRGPRASSAGASCGGCGRRGCPRARGCLEEAFRAAASAG